MSISARSQSGVRTPSRQSLGWRLTTTIVVIGTSVMALFGGAAYRLVEMTMLRAGASRAQTAATDVATLIGRAMRQNLDDLHQIAARPDLRDFIANPGSSALPETLRARLSTGPVPGIRRIEIWDNHGRCLLDVLRVAPDISSATVLPEGPAPAATGYSAMQLAGEFAFTDISDEIYDGPSADAKRLGFIRVRSTVTTNPSGAANQLIGTNATLLMGNRSGNVWTDLHKQVPGPLVDTSHFGSATFRRPDGTMRLGALAEIHDTPFVVWVDFPRAAIVAPAFTFLRAMAAVGFFLIVAGSV